MARQDFPARLPIVQAPMAGVQGSALTIAVSGAGGLGSLPCAMLSPEALEQELHAIQAADCRLYNLNFFCHHQEDVAPRAQTVWRDALAPYYEEYGIDSNSVTDGPARTPFSADALELIRPYRPPVVSFHFGLPRPEWIDQIKAWGGQVWSSATTLDEARHLADRGADAIIAQGLEAGGHRGMFLTSDLSTQVGTMALLESLVREIRLLVIAAGGMASPARIREAMNRGAWAAQVGTAYLCCSEADTSPVHRSALTSGAAAHTEITNVFSGRPARGIVNRVMVEMGPISTIVPAFPRAAAALAPLRKAAEARGRDDFSPLWCGTDATGCRAVSAQEQTAWLARDVV